MSKENTKTPSVVAHDVAESMESERQIVLNNIEMYEDAVTKFKEKIAELVNKGSMTEQTGTRIILDTERSFFDQIVQVEYK